MITASIAGGSSSAGYFSTCPPKSISVTLANGETTGTITQGVTQNLTTTILDTNGNPITGLTLDYQSTDPIDITAGAGGAITTSFPGIASVYAICQPTTCNPAPNNLFGLYGTGLSISSNPVHITVPGTASDYLWFAAPGQSQYVIPVELLSGSVGSTVRLPYVPNSMQMDRLGTNIYFGSLHELMIYNTASNAVTKQDTSAPGVVLAVAPNNSELLINDQVRQVFYLYTPNCGIIAAFGGVGNAAAWTPDSKTLYITDSAALNNTPENMRRASRPSDTLYVYNVNTGWSTYPLAASGSATSNPHGAQNLAITIPGVGAFLSGSPTVAHTWCPTGTVGNAASLLYYPQSRRRTIQWMRPPKFWLRPQTATTYWARRSPAPTSHCPTSEFPSPHLNCHRPPDPATIRWPLAIHSRRWRLQPRCTSRRRSQPMPPAVNQVVPSPNSRPGLHHLQSGTHQHQLHCLTTCPYYVPDSSRHSELCNAGRKLGFGDHGSHCRRLQSR